MTALLFRRMAGFSASTSDLCTSEMKSDAVANARANSEYLAIRDCETESTEWVKDLDLYVACKLLSPFGDLQRGYVELNAKFKCVH